MVALRRHGGFDWRPWPSRCVKDRRKRKTRPGGQPDGSSYMGAWGGWALAPNTASMGRDYRSHPGKSQEGVRTFNALSIFLTFSAGILASIFGKYFWQVFRLAFRVQNYCAAGLDSPSVGLPDARVAAAGCSRPRVAGTSCWSGALLTADGSEPAATGTADAATMAWTAA